MAMESRIDSNNETTQRDDSATKQKLVKSTVLVAGLDMGVGKVMAELFETYGLESVCANGLEEVRAAINSGKVSACFCGFWLVDGTYRDVVRQLRRQSADIPVIIVCAPECSEEYRDYLAALNIPAFDFFCHPYRTTDFERILESAVGFRKQVEPQPFPLTRFPSDALVSTELRRAS